MATLIGFDKCHYAICTDTNNTETYGTPKPAPGAISLSITPNTNSATLYADDGAYEEAAALGSIDVELGLADMDFAMQAEVLGHTLDKGVLTRASSDVQPYIALGGRSLKSNGKYRYFWLVKGKLSVPEQSRQTKGENVEYNTPTFSGKFLKRNLDNAWIIEADEDAANIEPTTITNWFTKVPVPAAGLSVTAATEEKIQELTQETTEVVVTEN